MSKPGLQRPHFCMSMNSKATSPYNPQVKNCAGNLSEKIIFPMQTGFSICVTYKLAQYSWGF